jgi:3',5'-cyclic AMP phosphodiesterase CpdA
MRLVWITDPHLNFLPPFGPAKLGELVAAEHPDAGAVVITGDIAECASLEQCLCDFASGWGRPVYFVLGNHDLYGGSMAAAAKAARAVERATKGRARWLTRSGVVALSTETALVGHDGWYDARLGAPQTTRVELADFFAIEELRGLDRGALLACVRQLGDRAAREAEPVLNAAAANAKRVVFATHVPPFREACWHQGAISNDEWLPWFTSKAMGDVLLATADAHPDTQLRVLCGHTHSEGRATLRPNLEVLTAKARYGAPDVHAVLDVA